MSIVPRTHVFVFNKTHIQLVCCFYYFNLLVSEFTNFTYIVFQPERSSALVGYEDREGLRGRPYTKFVIFMYFPSISEPIFTYAAET